MTNLEHHTPAHLDDLDLTRCVVGPDLVVQISDVVTVYRRRGSSVELVGAFDGPAAAFAALDEFDAPKPAVAPECPQAAGRRIERTARRSSHPVILTRRDRPISSSGS